MSDRPRDEAPAIRDGQPRPQRRRALAELAWVFLRLGTIAFGGPAAHIAMIEEEVVRRRGWMTRDELMDLIGAANLIPGPTSTELAIHIGHRRAGWLGLIVAGTCFIVPAFLIVSAIGWIYVHYGRLPQAQALMDGIKPVIIAVVAQALWGLTRTAVKSFGLGALGVAAAAATVLGVHELIVLLAGGVIGLAAHWPRTGRRHQASLLLPVVGLNLAPAVATTAALPFGLAPLFLVFLKVGAVLFGSGYVLLAFLRADLVERLHWLTNSQLIDAVAVGQMTPGPVFTTATFIGYILGGPVAGLVATIGIFLPAFVFVALSAPLVPRLRRSPLAAGFLDGVNVASLALMAVVTWLLARSAIVSYWTAAVALASAVSLIRFRVNSAWLVLAGGIVGLVLAR
jgi:chromate transporter